MYIKSTHNKFSLIIGSEIIASQYLISILKKRYAILISSLYASLMLQSLSIPMSG